MAPTEWAERYVSVVDNTGLPAARCRMGEPSSAHHDCIGRDSAHGSLLHSPALPGSRSDSRGWPTRLALYRDLCIYRIDFRAIRPAHRARAPKYDRPPEDRVLRLQTFQKR
nr:hypothetical protein CFP56_03905 [Quercus suber]